MFGLGSVCLCTSLSWCMFLLSCLIGFVNQVCLFAICYTSFLFSSTSRPISTHISLPFSHLLSSLSLPFSPLFSLSIPLRHLLTLVPLPYLTFVTLAITLSRASPLFQNIPIPIPH